jgi:hypothetical protein
MFDLKPMETIAIEVLFAYYFPPKNISDEI